MRVAGIDPGAGYTGIAVLEFTAGGPRLVSSQTITRDLSPELTGSWLPVPEDYLHRITAAAPTDVDVFAVEGVNAPSVHMGRATFKSGPILATAVVTGWCLHLAAAPVWVPPGHNGGAALGQYPDALVSDAERRTPGWRARVGGASARLRHERSAYDIALTGYRMRARRSR